MTPSQTVGPFFHFSLTAKPMGRMVTNETNGEPVHLIVRVFDGDGAPVSDAIVELWQADASGLYEHPEDARSHEVDTSFCGFGRMATDVAGTCAFDTIRPGAVPGLSGVKQAPHVNVILLARGMLSHLFTRIYFEGTEDNESDSVLKSVPPDRRSTLLARRDAESQATWNFDIHLSGERETVFFDL